MPNTVLISDYEKFCKAKIESLNERIHERTLEVKQNTVRFLRSAMSNSLFHLCDLLKYYKSELARCNYEQKMSDSVIELGNNSAEFYLWISKGG